MASNIWRQNISIMIPEDVAENLVSTIQSVTTKNRPRHTDVTVEGRACESDKYDGVEVSLKGPHVRLRPVIETLAGLDEWKVETINMIPDVDRTECPHCDEEMFEKSISMFCAYVSDSPRASASSISEAFV